MLCLCLLHEVKKCRVSVWYKLCSYLIVCENPPLAHSIISHHYPITKARLTLLISSRKQISAAFNLLILDDSSPLMPTLLFSANKVNLKLINSVQNVV